MNAQFVFSLRISPGVATMRLFPLEALVKPTHGLEHAANFVPLEPRSDDQVELALDVILGIEEHACAWVLDYAYTPRLLRVAL